MNAEEERELRAWATSLTTSTEPERKAMGKALLMLLRQIESLRSDLARSAVMPPPPDDRTQPADAQPTGELALDDMPTSASGDEGSRFSLRDAARRRRR